MKVDLRVWKWALSYALFRFEMNLKKNDKCIPLESQWQLYFVFEKTKVSLAVFVSVMDYITWIGCEF